MVESLELLGAALREHAQYGLTLERLEIHRVVSQPRGLNGDPSTLPLLSSAAVAPKGLYQLFGNLLE